MKYLFKKENLFLRILIGFLVGVGIGLLFPTFSINIKVLGDVYLNLIKMLITPIVFCSVFCGIVSLKDKNLLKSLGLKTVGLFTGLFIICGILTIILISIIKPGVGVVLNNIPEWSGTLANTTISSFLMKVVPSNILQAFVSGDTLSVILFTLIFGIACVVLNPNDTNKYISNLQDVVEGLKDSLYKVFEYFMEFSPVGVCSLIAYSISYYGPGVFGSLAKYIICCWLCCIVCFFLVLTIPTCLYTKTSLKKYLKACGKVAIVAMSTTSSAATLPTTIKTCTEDLEVPEDITNFVAPLGCTIHMCGGACSFMCLLLFVSQFYGINLSFGSIVYGLIVATLMNMAAPGIPGGGVVLGATFLTIMGLPIEFIGIYAGIYRLLDMIYTTMNVEGDIAANLIISKNLKKVN